METGQPMDIAKLATFFNGLTTVFPESKLEFVEDSAWLKVRYIEDGCQNFVIFSLPMDIGLDAEGIRAVREHNSIEE